MDAEDEALARALVVRLEAMRMLTDVEASAVTREFADVLSSSRRPGAGAEEAAREFSESVQRLREAWSAWRNSLGGQRAGQWPTDQIRDADAAVLRNCYGLASLLAARESAAREDEREACAMELDTLAVKRDAVAYGDGVHGDLGAAYQADTIRECAAAIRSRGKEPKHGA